MLNIIPEERGFAMFKHPAPYGPCLRNAQIEEAIRFLDFDFVAPALSETKRMLTPEKMLLLAVLKQAINDLLKYKSAVSRENQRLFIDARRYVFENHKADWPFSFENICEVFHFQPQAMRKGIAKLLLASD